MAREKEKPKRSVPLDEVQKSQMLAITVRNRVAHETVHELLDVASVATWSEPHALVWRAVRDHFVEYATLPPRTSIEARCHALLNDNPDLMDEDNVGLVDEFLDYAFSKEHGKIKSRESADIAVRQCQRFLQECEAIRTRENLLHRGTFAKDVAETIEESRDKINRIDSMTATEVDLPFPDGWDTRERIQLVSTGVEVWDAFLSGGWMAAEILLFMGPFGSCKTTITVHGVAGLIRLCAKMYAEALAAYAKAMRLRKKQRARGENVGPRPPKPKKPMVVLAFTEGDKATYRNRLLSNLAGVPWRRLNTMESVQSLSNAPQAGAEEDTEYEIKKFRRAIATGNFRPEQVRVGDAVRLANAHLVLLDCADGSDENKLNVRNVSDLARIFKAHFRRNEDCYPIALYLDHLSALANRFSATVKGDSDAKDKLRLFLKQAPLEIRDKILKPFGIPGAIMHQLSGEANTRGSTGRFHHSDSADCKAVAEYVDHAIVSGPPNEALLSVFDFTKHRRDPPTDCKVVKVRGNFQTIVDVSDTHFVDAVRRKILSRKDAEAASVSTEAGEATTKKKKKVDYAKRDE